MSGDPSRIRYSITVEAQDDAVLFCLRALWLYAERHPSFPAPMSYSTNDGRPGDTRATFHFSNPYNRGDFLGEATRLLAGKWTRVAVTDEPAE